MVRQRNCNHSAFNGYHRTYSDYSEVVCLACGSCGWTKARYVDQLRGFRRADDHCLCHPTHSSYDGNPIPEELRS